MSVVSAVAAAVASSAVLAFVAKSTCVVCRAVTFSIVSTEAALIANFAASRALVPSVPVPAASDTALIASVLAFANAAAALSDSAFVHAA